MICLFVYTYPNIHTHLFKKKLKKKMRCTLLYIIPCIFLTFIHEFSETLIYFNMNILQCINVHIHLSICIFSILICVRTYICKLNVYICIYAYLCECIIIVYFVHFNRICLHVTIVMCVFIFVCQCI